ncbi:hypothetical protein B0O80DRAFT_442447 [Mortierella sp. GBAus27b]|nr:hypothetical protein B0O80DRAFT_442447 [Mortierella sp. GBAus27b]
MSHDLQDWIVSFATVQNIASRSILSMKIDVQHSDIGFDQTISQLLEVAICCVPVKANLELVDRLGVLQCLIKVVCLYL